MNANSIPDSISEERTTNKYNKKNIQKVIDAIKVDGKKRFNMSTFVGKVIDPDFDPINDSAWGREIKQLSLEELTTDLFNCDSVGCIAGFSTAVANDWKNPFLGLNSVTSAKHISDYFEEASNDFLGFNAEEGKNLYYGDYRSVWKYLLYMEDSRFPELELEEDHTFDGGDDDWDDSYYNIDFNSISPRYAVTLLQMLIDDKIALCNDMGMPEYLGESDD